MLQMSKQYEPEFKKKIVLLQLEEGRTLKGLAAEYGVLKRDEPSKALLPNMAYPRRVYLFG